MFIRRNPGKTPGNPTWVNPITYLEFGISKLGFVSLKVYDVLGKEIAVLVDFMRRSPGKTPETPTWVKAARFSHSL